jgi:hypothetical protein
VQRVLTRRDVPVLKTEYFLMKQLFNCFFAQLFNAKLGFLQAEGRQAYEKLVRSCFAKLVRLCLSAH